MVSLSPFASPGRFWRGNLHTHSTRSDGELAPEAVIAAYRAAGYDFLCLSDHFMQHFNWPITDTTALRSADFTTLIGAELHARETSVGELWHILGVGLPLDFAPPAKHETGPELAQRAREAGAFIGIAHPAWSQLNLADGLALTAAHAVEIYNHGCAIENDRGDGWYLMDQLLTAGHHLSAYATDDAHFKTPDHFGGWVMVKAPELSPEALLHALKQGQYYSSQGPEIHDIQISGKEITITTSEVTCIAVLGGLSRARSLYGSALTSAQFNLDDMGRGKLSKGPSQWIRVVCIDDQGRRAWSNPYWLSDL